MTQDELKQAVAQAAADYVAEHAAAGSIMLDGTDITRLDQSALRPLTLTSAR